MLSIHIQKYALMKQAVRYQKFLISFVLDENQEQYWSLSYNPSRVGKQTKNPELKNGALIRFYYIFAHTHIPSTHYKQK